MVTVFFGRTLRDMPIIIHYPDGREGIIFPPTPPDRSPRLGHDARLRRVRQRTASQEDLDLIGLDTRTPAADLHQLAISENPDRRAAAALSTCLTPEDAQALLTDPCLEPRCIRAAVAHNMTVEDWRTVLDDVTAVRLAALGSPRMPEPFARECLTDSDITVTAVLLMREVFDLTFSDLALLAAREEVAWIEGGVKQLCDCLMKRGREARMTAKECGDLMASKHDEVRRAVIELIGAGRVTRPTD